jgi:hypothetical protein
MTPTAAIRVAIRTLSVSLELRFGRRTAMGRGSCDLFHFFSIVEESMAVILARLLA